MKPLGEYDVVSCPIEYIQKARVAQHNTNDEDHEALYRNFMFKGIETDLMKHNYQTLLDTYVNYFKTKDLKYETIHKGDCFFRGRLGKMIIKGMNEHKDMEFIVPFHNQQIVAPPHLLTKGGRFNREGVSYLYLASDEKTCIAEIHLQVGQECSIAQFQAKKDIKLLNLVEHSADIEMKIWYEIMTQPIYEGIQHHYLITQFLADVLSHFTKNGIWFYSSQTKNRKKGEGRCIVSMRPSQFELVPCSERLFKATSMSIKANPIEDSADVYAENEGENPTPMVEATVKKEEEMQYFEQLIAHRKAKKQRA